MSFRYTNFLIGTFTQRILLHRALTQISTRTYIGRSSNGVIVTSNAYGKVLDIKVEESSQKLFTDEATGVVNNSSLLSQSIRAALFDINMRIRQDKEEVYRESIRNSPDLMKNNHYELWYANNGSSLPPFAYEAIKDEPLVEALKEQQQEGKSSEKKSNSNNSNNKLGKMRAEKNNSLAACMPEYAGSLLQLEDPIVVNEKQRMRYDDAERAFWQRVDLIRRAQMNTIAGERKRGYEEFETKGASTLGTSASDVSRQTKMKFVR